MQWAAFALALLGLSEAGLLWWVSDSAVQFQLTGVMASALAGSLAVVWTALDKRFEKVPLGFILGLALLLRLVAVQATPLLEDDQYRYLWDGFRTVTAFDPYRAAPSAFFDAPDLAPQWQAVLSGINHPDIPTLYGPVLQYLFALAHLIAPCRIGSLQGLLLALDMGCLLLLAQQGVAARWLLIYAVHPMLLKEAMASAHPDGLVAFWLLLAMLAWRKRWVPVVGACCALAVATKVAALVAVPLFLLHRRPAGATAAEYRVQVVSGWGAFSAGFAVTLMAVYLPFWLTGASEGAGLSVFASHWRFNPLLFQAVEAVVQGNSARIVCGLMVLVCVAALVWRGYAATTVPRRLPPVDMALLALLVWAPVVNPWYWLWALGPAVLAGRCAVVVAACVGSLAYLNTTVLQQAGWSNFDLASQPFNIAWPIAAAQVIAIGVGLAVDRFSTLGISSKAC